MEEREIGLATPGLQVQRDTTCPLISTFIPIFVSRCDMIFPTVLEIGKSIQKLRKFVFIIFMVSSQLSIFLA